MSGSQINHSIRTCLSDEGFCTEIPVDLVTDATTAAGLVFTGNAQSGSAVRATIDTNSVILTWAAGNAGALLLKKRLPKSLARWIARGDTAVKSTVKLIVRGAVNGTTDTVALTVTAQIEKAGTALGSALTPTASPNLSNSTTVASDVEYEFRNAAIVPGADIVFSIVPGTHATDAVRLHSASIEIHVNANFTDEDDRW